MQSIIEYLKQLDLSEVEAKIYMTLIKGGPKRVRELAQSVGLKRTTAYFHIDSLIAKGLIAEEIKGSRAKIIANPPQWLKYLVDKKVKTAKVLSEQYPAIVRVISTSFSKSQAPQDETEIKYFKGINGVKLIYEEALKSKELCLYATLSELIPLFPDDPDLFDNALKANSALRIYEIYGDSPDEIKKFSYTAKNKRYFYKFMPSGISLSSPGILHYDNKVAIINVKGKISGIVLKNTDYYVNSKKLFYFIWKMLPEPKI